MPFEIIRNDITKVRADVIVNTANPLPLFASGTDSAVYRAAGWRELLAARREIGRIKPGRAAATPAFRLPAKHIIHTVGPRWVDGAHGEKETLRSCYRESLSLAATLQAESVAFPLIASGVYGFPKDEALSIALDEIGRFLLAHDMKVILVVFDRKAFELSAQLMGRIDAYIDEHGVGLVEREEYADEPLEGILEWDRVERQTRRRNTLLTMPFAMPDEAEKLSRPEQRKKTEVSHFPVSEAMPPLPGAAGFSDSAVHGKSLDEMLGQPGETFQQRLLELIDQSGMDDVTVYKNANIDRKVFSRIRCKKDYRPKKKTAVAFAIALRLDMPTMLDLLSRAEIAFSPSSKFDLIITYFVTNGIYDMFEINAALFRYGQQILGE